MKQLIRNKVFETNSSSMHSIVISNIEDNFNEEEIEDSFGWIIDDAGLVDLSDGDRLCFGRAPFRLLTTYFEKFCYYIASKRYSWDDEEYNNYLNEIKILHPFIKDFKFGIEYEETNYGSIDHESSALLENFLLDNNLEIEDFLKSKRYVIVIDGDEYCIFNSFERAKLIGKVQELVNPTKEEQELEKMFKLMNKGFNYSGLDGSTIIKTSNEEYSNEELYKYVYPQKDGALNLYHYDWEDKDPSCLFLPKDKFEWCYKVLFLNKDKIEELNNIAINRWNEVTKVTYNKNDFITLKINISDHKLILEYLKQENITLEEFIFNKKYKILNDGQMIPKLIRANVLNYNKIKDIFNIEDIND